MPWVDWGQLTNNASFSHSSTSFNENHQFALQCSSSIGEQLSKSKFKFNKSAGIKCEKSGQDRTSGWLCALSRVRAHGLCNSSPGVTTQGWLWGLGELKNWDRWDKGRIFFSFFLFSWWENAFHCSNIIQSPLIFASVEWGAEEYLVSASAAWSWHLDQGQVCPVWVELDTTISMIRHCIPALSHSCGHQLISIAWWLWPLLHRSQPLMCEWKTKLSLPMSPLDRQKDCSSGNAGQEVSGGSRPFVLNTTLL